MFKPIDAVFLCGLLGFGAWIYFSPKSAVEDTPKKEQVFPYPVGKTKAGEPCRIVSGWGDGMVDNKLFASYNRNFLQINTKNDSKADEYGFKYDCFLDIDTQEYKLVDYEKTEKLSGGYRETYFFENRDDSAECIRFQYNIVCEVNSSEQLLCGAIGECTQKKPQLKLFLSIGCSVLFSTVLLCLIINDENY